MTVLIKGMEMPEENHDYGGVKVWIDLRVYTDGSVSCRNLTGDFVDFGKCAVEVPTPHGRLIDADELIDHQHYEYLSDEFYVTVRDVDNAPTIIEAEGE